MRREMNSNSRFFNDIHNASKENFDSSQVRRLWSVGVSAIAAEARELNVSCKQFLLHEFMHFLVENVSSNREGPNHMRSEISTCTPQENQASGDRSEESIGDCLPPLSPSSDGSIDSLADFLAVDSDFDETILEDLLDGPNLVEPLEQPIVFSASPHQESFTYANRSGVPGLFSPESPGAQSVASIDSLADLKAVDSDFDETFFGDLLDSSCPSPELIPSSSCLSDANSKPCTVMDKSERSTTACSREPTSIATQSGYEDIYDNFVLGDFASERFQVSSELIADSSQQHCSTLELNHNHSHSNSEQPLVNILVNRVGEEDPPRTSASCIEEVNIVSHHR